MGSYVVYNDQKSCHLEKPIRLDKDMDQQKSSGISLANAFATGFPRQSLSVRSYQQIWKARQLVPQIARLKAVPMRK